MPKANAEATNTTPSTSYFEADRSDADQVLASALTDNVFSDRFTALRKQLVATSLRGNPAPGCAEPPVFTLEVVSLESRPLRFKRIALRCEKTVVHNMSWRPLPEKFGHWNSVWYDAKANRDGARNICPVIPYKSNAIDRPAFFPKILYQARARIEQAVGKLDARRPRKTTFPS